MWFANRGQVLQLLAASASTVVAVAIWLSIPPKQFFYLAPLIIVVAVGWVTVALSQAVFGQGGQMRTLIAAILGLAIVLGVFGTGVYAGVQFYGNGGVLIVDNKLVGPMLARPVTLCNFTLAPPSVRDSVTGGYGTGITGGSGSDFTSGGGTGPNSGGGAGPNGGGGPKPKDAAGIVQPPPPSGIVQPPSGSTVNTPPSTYGNNVATGTNSNSAPTGSSGTAGLSGPESIMGGCQKWTYLGSVVVVWPY